MGRNSMFQDLQSESLLHQDTLEWLEQRLGRVRAIQRLEIETEHEAERMGRGGEGWSSSIRNTLKAMGLYRWGRKNAERIQVRHHYVSAPNLPALFDGFTILHLSDLHIDMNPGALARLLEILEQLKYDMCVLTGDYRGRTFGSCDEAIEGLACLRPSLGDLVYGVLGNHDTARMVPGMEEIGVQMLLNESIVVQRGSQRLY